MGLRDLLGGTSTPDRSDLGKFKLQGGYGHMFAIDLACRAQRACEQLQELHNASRSDVRAFAASTHSVFKLARELDAVDNELVESSHSELRNQLDAHMAFRFAGGYGGTPGYFGRIEADPLEFSGSPNLIAGERSWATRWVDENVDGPQRQDFLDLIERHDQLAQATHQAWQGFRETIREIERAVEKQRVIDAAAQVDARAGAEVLPESELDKVQEAKGLVSSISAGLDEAYSRAKPTLDAIDETPGPFSRSSAAAEIELGR